MVSSTTNYDPLFPQQGRDITLEIMSRLDYPDILRFLSVCKGAYVLKEKAERRLFSRIEIFDRTHWKEYWGVDITDQYDADKIEIRILRAFLKTYFKHNPLGPGRVKDACLIPAVVPAASDLMLLGKVAKKPKKGHGADYKVFSWALEAHGKKCATEPKLIVLLKEVVCRDQSWEDQVQFLNVLNDKRDYKCVTDPDAISQITVLFAHHAVTGECPFGDNNGMEGKWTYGRTRELVHYVGEESRMMSGGFTAMYFFASAGLHVTDSPYDDNSKGIAVMSKF